MLTEGRLILLDLGFNFILIVKHPRYKTHNIKCPGSESKPNPCTVLTLQDFVNILKMLPFSNEKCCFQQFIIQ